MRKCIAALVCALALAPSIFAQEPADQIAFPACNGAAVTSISGVLATGEVAVLSAILLENEAGMGRVAYCLSDARMTNNKNGLSFGFNQYDLKANARAQSVLATILKTARTADPSLALSAEDVVSIEGGALARTTYDLRKNGTAETTGLITRINAALSSPAGKQAIDKDYADWIVATIADFDRRFAGMDNAIGAKAALASDMPIRLLILDYENFFGEAGSALKGYLAGKPATLSGGVVQAAAPLSFTDIMRFALATKQGSGPARDQRAEILRRINNAVKYYAGLQGEIALGARDAAYLKDELKVIINDQSNPHVLKRVQNGQLKALTDLVARAERQ